MKLVLAFLVASICAGEVILVAVFGRRPRKDDWHGYDGGC